MAKDNRATGNTKSGQVIQSGAEGPKQKLNMKRLENAYRDYAYERAYKTFKSFHDLEPNGRYGKMSEADLQYEAKNDAAKSVTALQNVFRRLHYTIDTHGGTIDVAQSLPASYRPTNTGEGTFATVKYKGIFPVSGQTKNPEYNPNSRVNKDYTKQFGNVSFGFGIELPKAVIDNYYKKKK